MNQELELHIDFRVKAPIYQQIVEQVEELAADGRLKPGDQLPTVRQLAADLQVNFNTVARAYRLLDEAGVISTQHGRGTYILDSRHGPTRLAPGGKPGLTAEPAGQSKPARKDAPAAPGSRGRAGGTLPAQTLEELARRFFEQASRLGCSEEEMLSALEVEFERWQKR